MQCDAVWNLNEAERRWVCHQGMVRGRRVGAWGAGEGASGLIRMRLTMAEARKLVNAAAQGERDRDRGLGVSLIALRDSTSFGEERRTPVAKAPTPPHERAAPSALGEHSGRHGLTALELMV